MQKMAEFPHCNEVPFILACTSINTLDPKGNIRSLTVISLDVGQSAGNRGGQQCLVSRKGCLFGTGEPCRLGLHQGVIASLRNSTMN
jgi:hypothetical protein